MPQLLRLWWSWTISDVTASAGRAVRLTPTRIRWSAACTAGAFEANSSEQRGGWSALESRSVAGGRAWHGQGAGRVAAVEAAHESYRDALDRYVRAACVSLCRSESSHEDARVPHAPVPWQALGSLQAVFHESIISIPSLRDS